MPTSSTPLSSRPPHVLIVEDEPSIVELLRALMEPMGVDVVAAQDSTHALAALSGEAGAALITLDLLLPGPGSGGHGVLEQVRQRRDLDDVPVLVISAQGDLASQKRAYQGGASDFVAKPFNVDLLEAKLRMWLRLSRLGDHAQRLRDFAHEARNPLAAITAAAQVICRADADPAMRRRLGRAIEDEADRIGRLIQACLNDHPSGDPDQVAMAPYRLLLDVVEVNLPDPAARSRVRVGCAGPLPAVRVDPDRLRQMLLNLLDNALAATAEGGEIAVEAFYDEAAVAVAVHDTGIGIPDEVLPHIFEDGFTTRRGAARGLGLGIVQRLCRAAGGRMEVTSRAGRGSTFALWLPRFGVASGP